MVIRHFFLKDDGTFPNNGKLPVLLYKSAWELPLFKATYIKSELKRNSWGNSWRDGIYDYNHYHSTAHEVLCAFKGSIKVLLGGDHGVITTFEAGDVLIIPAGVAHKNIEPASPFKCIGAYPLGQDYDMNYGKPGERPAADEKILKVPLPEEDPVFGKFGPLKEYWKAG